MCFVDNVVGMKHRQFLELLRMGMWPEYRCEAGMFKECDWVAMFQMSDTQAVSGIVFDGLQKLYEMKEVALPDQEFLYEWIGMANMQEAIYAEHVGTLIKTHRRLQEEGIDHVFMKGLTCGVRYPNPYHRTCGDIDFVVNPKDFQRTLKTLETIGKVDYDLVHEHHGMAYVGDVVLEPHYKVHNYQNKSHNRAMQEMFEEVFPEQLMQVEIGGEVIPVFPETFEGVFLVSHMVNHVYEEGLGLRQVIDYALFLDQCHDKIDWSKYGQSLKRMGMERAHRIFTRICERYLGLSAEICHHDYTEKEMAFAQKMMQDIMSVGNFGRGGYVFSHDSRMDELKNFCWVAKRAMNLCYLCPSEAYLWPLSKFQRYFSKKINPSKYKV